MVWKKDALQQQHHHHHHHHCWPFDFKLIPHNIFLSRFFSLLLCKSAHVRVYVFQFCFCFLFSFRLLSSSKQSVDIGLSDGFIFTIALHTHTRKLTIQTQIPAWKTLAELCKTPTVLFSSGNVDSYCAHNLNFIFFISLFLSISSGVGVWLLFVLLTLIQNAFRIYMCGDGTRYVTVVKTKRSKYNSSYAARIETIYDFDYSLVSLPNKRNLNSLGWSDAKWLPLP